MGSRKKFLVITILLFAVTLAASVVVTPVLGASPYFDPEPRIEKNANNSLTTIFEARGLPDIVTEAFLTSSGGTAKLRCVNTGGSNAPAKQVTFEPLRGRVTFIQPSNSEIRASATIGPPTFPSASQICPNSNWSMLLMTVTYSNIVLHLPQNGVDILTFDFGMLDP